MCCNNNSNHLNLKSQNAIDIETSDLSFPTPETPETPSCANLSLNEKVHKSLSFCSSTIVDFECDFLFASDVCSESIFIEDPFADES